MAFSRASAERLARSAVRLVENSKKMTRKQFDKLLLKNPAKARTLIAADVIKQIMPSRRKVKNMRVMGGRYFESDVMHSVIFNEIEKVHEDKSLSRDLSDDVLEVASQGCRVCARGAIFISSIGLRNKLTESILALPEKHKLEREVTDSVVIGRTDSEFGGINAAMIETAFEGRKIAGSGSSEDLTYDQIYLCQAFNEKWFDSTNDSYRHVLLVIMANVIRNNGEFKPEDNPGDITNGK